jgi:hypothetical protein
MHQLAEPHISGVDVAVQLFRAWKEDIPRGTGQYLVEKGVVGLASRVALRSQRCVSCQLDIDQLSGGRV